MVGRAFFASVNPGTAMPDVDALAEAILAADALRFGEFELAHGGTSSYYIDKYRFETDPAALSTIAAAFGAVADGRPVAGVALGAVPLATATALHTGDRYAIVRKAAKDYGTGNRIEGSLEPGGEVLVLEDVATTGTSALEAVEALRAAGVRVDEVATVVDRESGATARLEAADVRHTPLLTASDLLARAEDGNRRPHRS